MEASSDDNNILLNGKVDYLHIAEGTKWKDKRNIPEGSHWTGPHCHLETRCLESVMASSRQAVEKTDETNSKQSYLLTKTAMFTLGTQHSYLARES